VHVTVEYQVRQTQERHTAQFERAR